MFAKTLAHDPELQKRLTAHVRKHPEMLLKIAEHAFGRPRQALQVDQGDLRFIQWPGNEDIAEE